ncbi:MAG: UpxY family transcription antiterminator [Agriterribacter sp.]
MNNESNKFWYVIYTKPRWEKKVAEALVKKGIDQYCPLNKVQKQWHDRRKIVFEPLFVSYVFVYTTPEEHTYIKNIPGIVNFVHWLGKPAVVRKEEIEGIKQFLAEHKNVQLEKTNVSVDDTVKIIHGPFMHREGKIVQVNNNSVKIELPSIGYALIAQVNRSHIEIMPSSFINEELVQHPKKALGA